jgi:RNA polymerase-binding protein DksA
MATTAAKKSAPARPSAAVKKATKAPAKKAATAAKKPAGDSAPKTAKQSATKKATGTTASTTAPKSPARKTPARTSPARKGSARKTPATTPEKKVAVKSSQTAAEASAGTSAVKRPAPKAASSRSAKNLTVGAGESPWTAAELTELRAELEHDAEHLREEIHEAEEEIAGLLRDGGDGAGNDQADMGSTTFERDHEMSLANNARDMLMQTERALARIDDGSYGVCESCGNPIGKGRLQAFPRATLCVSCKEREERR